MLAGIVMRTTIGIVLALLPLAARAGDNPWRVPSAPQPAYGGDGPYGGEGPNGRDGQWLGAGWRGTERAAPWGGETWRRETPPQPSRCAPERRWASVDHAVLTPGSGQRRMTDATAYPAVHDAQPQTDRYALPPSPGWSRSVPHYEAGPQIVLGDFPPLEDDTHETWPPRRAETARRAAPPPPAAPAPYGYAWRAPAPAPLPTPGYALAAPLAPTTLAAPWGGYGGGYAGYGGGYGAYAGYGGYGSYGGYAPYGYPFASGVPAPYGWY